MVTSLFQNRKLNQAYLDDLGDSTFHQNHSTADKITVKQKQTGKSQKYCLNTVETPHFVNNKAPLKANAYGYIFHII